MTMATDGRKPGGSETPPPEKKPEEMQVSPRGNEEVEKRTKTRIKVEIVIPKKKGKMDTTINRFAAVKSVIGNLLETQSDISICDKDGRMHFSHIDGMPKDQSEFTKFFPTSVEDKKGSKKLTTEITVLSSRSIEEIKRKEPDFFNYLVDNNIYMKENKYDKLETKEVGFFAGKSAKLTWRPDFEKYIHDALTETTSASVPKFEVLAREMRHREKSGFHSAKVLVIKCETDNADLLKEMLTNANLDKYKVGQFIPFGVSLDKFYEAALHSQNEMEKNLKCIPVFGLSKEAMEAKMEGEHNPHENMKAFFLDSLKASDKEPLIDAVERTTQTETDGKWMFICQIKHFDEVKQYVETDLQKDYMESSKYEDESLNTKYAKYPSPSMNRRTTPINANLDSYANTMMKQFSDFEYAVTDDSSQHKAQKKGNRRNQPYQPFGDTTTFDTTSDEIFPALPNHKKKSNRNNVWNRKQEEKQNFAKRLSGLHDQGDFQESKDSTDVARADQEFRQQMQQDNLKFQTEIRLEIANQNKKLEEQKDRDDEKNDKLIACIEEKFAELIKFTMGRTVSLDEEGADSNTKRQLLNQFSDTKQIAASPSTSSPKYKKQKENKDEEMNEENSDSAPDAVPTPSTLDSKFSSSPPASPLINQDNARSPPPTELRNGVSPTMGSSGVT
jgi:hypothetical protein